jgi:probable HAF family extracellular repeat protein
VIGNRDSNGRVAVLWENGTVRELPKLPDGKQTYAYGINNAGQIAGEAEDADGEWHAVIWENGTIKTLSMLPGTTFTLAGGINNLGQVAGGSGDYAAVWSGPGSAFAPAPPPPPPPPVTSGPGATPTGSNVSVEPKDPVTGATVTAVDLTFDNVSGAGTTTVALKSIDEGSSPPAPVGFQLGDPPTYYDIKTTATFSGKVLVCIDYASVQFTDQSQLKLLHYEIKNGIGAWEDMTTSVNTATKQLCGETTSFSPFLVAQKRYAFTGFLRPLESASLNTVKAGSGVPIRFGLGGNRGLQIFQTGYPLSRSVSCEGTMASGTVAETVTVTAGKSALSYDASTNQYIYAWQTDKAWAGSCRELVMRLVDGTEHKLRFKFTR